jgi:aspartokinase/homoserine dehydrogenase 1
MTAPLKNRDRSLGSAEPLARPTVAAPASHPHRLIHGPLHGRAKKSLRVMKFGGTSVADASCIRRVTAIVRDSVRESSVVVVVSAMSGVTSKLVEAAAQAEAGNSRRVAIIWEELRERHARVGSALILSAPTRERIRRKMHDLFQTASVLCQDVALGSKLTPCALDSIIGLGERLSILLVAAALAEQEVASEAIETTELVVTDSNHGAAEPFLDLTRARCEARLGPLLLRGVVPVVTGFIGATVDGVLTTLGRNSSDYSGTILGAALDADEVTLWTDVDGILTADPKIVSDARSIPEMSYHEACALAEMGAKVLHPKTLRPILQRGIPLLIRNTFAPDRPGTKITASGPRSATRS